MPNRRVSSATNGKTLGAANNRKATLPDMGIKERLLEIWKEAANESNAELARLAGVSRATVTQWLQGRIHSLQAITALTLQERTGYSARWLVLNRGPKKLEQQGQWLPEKVRTQEPETENERLVAILNAWLDSDKKGRDAIWAATRLAIKRAATNKPFRKSPPANGE